MDYVRIQLERLQQQLAALTASQKMLTFTLVAIMVMTLLWWGRYAGQNEMAPLLEQALSHDDVARMTAKIQSRGIPYRVVGDQVLVPVDRRFEVIAELGYAQLLPRDTGTGFDEIVRQMSPWDSTTRSAALLNHARQQSLAEVIRRFPGVANAAVMLDPTTNRQIGRGVEPTGTVYITMRDHTPPNRQLIEAAADVLAGAQAGLSRGRVKVVIDGRSYPVRDRHDQSFVASGETIELIQQHETRWVNSINRQLSYISGVLVSVTVDVNTRSVEERRFTPDIDNVIREEIEIVRRSEESSGPSRITEEPGVMPNSPMGLPPEIATGGGGQTSRDEETTRMLVETGGSEQLIRSPAGDATVLGASVLVPRSFFSNTRGGGSDADEEAVSQAVIDEELAKIRNLVMRLTRLGEDAVMVDVYADAAPMLAGMTSPPPASAVSSLVSMRGREIALGALAVISLFMAMMIVRKGTSPQDPRPGQTAYNAAPLPAGELLAGQAGEGNGILAGMELDEETIRAKQMLEQVSEMVEEDPDAAAGLVKRWLNRP